MATFNCIHRCYHPGRHLAGPFGKPCSSTPLDPDPLLTIMISKTMGSTETYIADAYVTHPSPSLMLIAWGHVFSCLKDMPGSYTCW